MPAHYHHNICHTPSLYMPAHLIWWRRRRALLPALPPYLHIHVLLLHTHLPFACHCLAFAIYAWWWWGGGGPACPSPTHLTLPQEEREVERWRWILHCATAWGQNHIHCLPAFLPASESLLLPASHPSHLTLSPLSLWFPSLSLGLGLQELFGLEEERR